MSDSNRTIRRFPTATELNHAAAELFVSHGRQAIATSGRFAVVLAGGATPRRLYSLLTERPYRDQLDWSAVEWFFGDERAVAPDDAESNYRMVQETLFAALDIPAARIHRMFAERADLAAAAADYQAEIATVFDVDVGVAVDPSPPAFDLVLLGMGTDGHTASLFPHTKALADDHAWVVANDVSQLGTRRMTLTLPVLNSAAGVMLLVTGADKAAVLAEVLEGPPDEQRLPAQSVRPSTGKLLWLIDAAAAARLSGSK